MYQIICPECSNATKFESIDKRPDECSFCFASFDKDLTLEEIEDARGKLCGLRLIYQLNSETIIVKGDFNFLGRQNTGKEVLSKIIVNGCPVISRKQCSITFTNGSFYLKDEGSTNGTYYGVSKLDCSKGVYEIEDKSIIFLGKEAFLVQYLYEEQQEKVIEKIETNKTKRYRCNEGCGYESEIYEEICPRCMTSNSLVEIT